MIKGQFAKNLHKAVSERGIKQVELAKVLEVPPTTVNGWMRGAHLPDIEKLMEICDYLEMPVGEMLGDHRHINDLDEVKHLIPNRGIQPIINQLRGYKKKIKKDGKVVAEKWIPSILVSDPEATKYCLKLDVRKYYPSIVHDVLKAKYRELFKDEELIWLMDEIIDSISTCPATEENIEILQRLGVAVNIIIDDNGREFVDGVGIPIGNYVSQYDGNFNLSVVDHWLKEVKGVKYYFRYMDDMVIFGSSKEELHKLKRELDEFMAVNLKQVLKHNWQVFPTKVRGVDFVGYRFFGEYTLLRKSTCKTFKRRMLSISSKRENNVSPTYSEWCSFNSYVGWLQHCDSFRLYQKYVEPNVEYMHNYYLKEVKGNAEICKRKNYSGERKAS